MKLINFMKIEKEKIMVNHIVAWNIQEQFNEKREEIALEAKNRLESLVNAVPGIISINVIINEMQSSTVDVTLMCKFETEEALNAYQVCPKHLEVAKYIKAHMCNRTCIDYVE